MKFKRLTLRTYCGSINYHGERDHKNQTYATKRNTVSLINLHRSNNASNLYYGWRFYIYWRDGSYRCFDLMYDRRAL